MNLRRHPMMAMLMVLAVAASAALSSGLEIASRGVRRELQANATAIIGRAEFEVLASKRGVPEAFIERVAAVPGVGMASPLITETFRLGGSEFSRRPVHVLGVDMLAEHQVRDYSVTQNHIRVRDPLMLLGNANSAILSSSLRELTGIPDHGLLAVITPRGKQTLRIEGTLASGPLAAAYAGQVALMDIWSLQKMLGAEGWIDKLEITLDPKANPDRVLEAIRKQVSGVATVRQTSERRTWAGPVLGVIDFAAWSINVLGLLIASLLAYSAISHAVIASLEDLAIMRCVGLTPLELKILILLQAAMLSAIGAGVGAIGGIALAPPLLAGFSRLSEHVQNVPIEAAPFASGSLIVIIGVWLAVTVLAALLPIRNASRTKPLDVLTMGRAPTRHPPPPPHLLILGALGFSAILGLVLQPDLVSSDMRTITILGGGLTLIILASGHLLLLAVQKLRPWLARIPGIASAVGTSILTRPRAISVSIASIAGVVCIFTAVLTVIQSITSSIDEVIETRTQGAVSISAFDPLAGLQRQAIRPSTIATIQSIPGITDLALYYNLFQPYKGEEILVGALSARALARQHGFDLDASSSEGIAVALEHGEIAISHAFQHRFSASIGDSITLATRQGPATFRIAGFYRDYSGRAGSVHLDVNTFDKYFDRNGAHFIRIWASRPLPELIGEINARTQSGQALYFRSGKELRGAASRVARKFRDLLGILAGVAAFFSSIALLNLQLGGVASRRRELSLLRTAGATPADLSFLVLFDGMLVAGCGMLLGVALGAACGATTSQMFFDRFGWIVTYHADAASLITVTLLTGSVTVIVGAFSARFARRDAIIGAMVTE